MQKETDIFHLATPEQASQSEQKKIVDLVKDMRIEQWDCDNPYEKKVKDQAEEFQKMVFNNEKRNQRKQVFIRGFLKNQEFDHDPYWVNTSIFMVDEDSEQTEKAGQLEEDEESILTYLLIIEEESMFSRLFDALEVCIGMASVFVYAYFAAFADSSIIAQVN